MKENNEGMQILCTYTGKISTAIKAADELQLSMYRSHATVVNMQILQCLPW